MRFVKRVGILILLALAGSISAPAQNPAGQPPPATVGVPYTFDILAALGVSPTFQSAGYTVTISFVFDPSMLPPGIMLSTAGLISGTPTTPGTYTATGEIVISVSPSLPGYPISKPTSGTLVVLPGTGPPLTADSGGISFSLAAGAGAVERSFPVTSHSGTPQSIQVSASGGSWLTVSGGGTVPAFGSSAITVTVNPSTLVVGTYTGAVTISGSFAGSPLKVPVVVTITGSQPLLTLSQSGLFFRTSQGGPAPPSQSFTVSNGGAGTLNWTASASTFSGGNWLSVAPAAGVSSGSVSTPVAVQINPAGLAAGTYYGQVQVSSSGAANSPQFVSVVLNVLASGTNVDPDVHPTALIFVGKQGGANPAAKPVQLTNLGSTLVTYSASVLYTSKATGWLSVSPGNGTIVTGTPSSPSISATTGSLAPGVYMGQVSLNFVEPKTLHEVAVVFIVLPSGSVAAPEGELGHAGGCSPTQLAPVFSSLGQNFVTSAAWPSSIEVTVVDDCGNPLTTGSVITSFSSGDPPISLTSLNDGRWSGTWTPQVTVNTSVTITAAAQSFAPPLSGTTMIGGSANANPGVPIVGAGGIVNAASNAASTPVAPGSYVAIYGSALAQGPDITSAPFPTQLGQAQVLLAGQALPIYYASDSQIDALIPYGLSTNSTIQVVVARGGAYSTPQPLTVADGGPAIFSNGKAIVGPSPAAAGDVLVLYCNGLGAVNQPLAAGAIAPSSPLATTINPVGVTIEGIPAQVLFAGLAPGFAGLYQVNVIIPAGVTTSAAAPLVITVAGQSSPATPISVQ